MAYEKQGFFDGQVLSASQLETMEDGIIEALGSPPSYWQTHLDTRVEEIRRAMEAAGRNKSAFLFYSDAHYDYGSQRSPMLLKYLYENTQINKTVFGGDIVNTESADDAAMEYLYAWRKAIRDLPNHHSVVGNHDDGNTNTATGGATNSVFNSDYVYAYLMAPEETSDIVRGGDFFYYIDSPNEKTRYLYLDTGFLGQFNLGTEQTNFINESLKSTPANWHIVVISHIWYVPDYSQYSQRPVPLTGLSTAAAQLATILDNYNARNGDFSACAAKVEFCMGGHIHYDYVDKTPGGIPIILCETDGSGIRGSYTYTAGTISEAAVSAVIADYDAQKVHIIRIGRGVNHVVDLTTTGSNVTPTYTNVLNQVGYQVGYRVNSSGVVTERADRCTTGLIAAKTGDTVYFKNIQMLGSDYGRSIAHYNGSQAFISGKSWIISNNASTATYADDGVTLLSYQISIADTEYVRFSFVSIDDSSVITVNEPLT